MPASAWRITIAPSGRSVARDDRRVELIGLLAPRLEHDTIEAQSPAARSCVRAASPGRGEAQADRGTVAWRDLSARGGPPTLVPVPAGLTASPAPPTTNSLIASLAYREAFGAPNSRSLFVSFSQNSISPMDQRSAPSRPARVSAARDAGDSPGRPRRPQLRLDGPRRPTTRCYGTTAWAGDAGSPCPARGCGRLRASGCRRGRPWRTRRPRRNSGPRRRSRCPGAHTPSPACRGRRSSTGGPRTGMRACGYLYWHFM